MSQTFFEKWRHRFGSAWDVLTGRAWAGYGNPNEWRHVDETTYTCPKCGVERGILPACAQEGCPIILSN